MNALMNALMTRLQSYNTSVSDLEKKFRFWHVEALLNQANELFEKCLVESQEYDSVTFLQDQIIPALRAEELELSFIRYNIAKRVTGQFYDYQSAMRNYGYASDKKTYFSNTQLDYNDSVTHAYSSANTQPNDWRAAQTLKEKFVERAYREFEKAINERQLKYTEEELANSDKRVAFRENDLQNKKMFYEVVAVGGEVIGELGYFRKKLNEIESRLKSNYENGLDRLVIANEGLKIIYDFDNLDFPTGDKRTISQLVLWNREAIESVVAYQQLDQGFTRIISVRSLFPDDSDWKNLYGKDTILPIPSDFFNTHENVRLRGIGASIVGNAGLISWTVEISIPKDAVYRRRSKKDVTKIEYYPVDQNKMPTCLLGRVENSKSPRPTEIGGLVSLTNASPIGDSNKGGQWSIKIIGPANSNDKNEEFSEIADLLLELRLVGVSSS